MKKFLLMLMPLAVLVTGCRYDDTDVWDELNNHETRILALENVVNTDLAALQAAVDALNQKVYVQSVTTTENGFTVTFTNGNSYTISNGETGHTPVVSVKQDEDEIWYWTVDGEWLLDDDGKQVRADAVAPLVKLEDKKWYISTDDGATWTEAGTSVGDALFKGYEITGGFLVLTLWDDTTISIPMAGKVKLQVVFDESAIQTITAGESVSTAYTLTVPEGEDFEFTTFETGGYSATITPDDETGLTGTITVSAPSTATGGKILFILTGSSSSFVKTVTISTDPRIVVPSTYSVDSSAGEVEISVRSNVAYTSSIEGEATWITKGVAENVFVLAENTDESSDRSATITFSAPGAVSVSVVLTQNAKEAIVLTSTTEAAAADDEEIAIVISANSTVTANPDVEWITIAEATKSEFTEKVFTLTLAANNTGEERTGHVEFTAVDAKQTVTVTQSAEGSITIADIKEASNGAVSGYIHDAVVSFVAGSYAYVEDSTGGIPIYNAGGIELVEGTVINGVISGSKSVYNGAPQIKDADFSKAVLAKGTAPEAELTLAELLADDETYDKYYGRKVKLVGVAVSQGMSASSRTGIVAQGETTYQIYNSDAGKALSLYAEDVVDLYVFPSYYNSTKQASVFDGCLVKVYPPATPTVTFASASLTLEVSATAENPVSTDSDGTVTYSTSDEKVATVDENGTVTAVAVGTATITASVSATDNYKAKAVTCEVNVLAEPEFTSIAELNKLATATAADVTGKLTDAVVSFVPSNSVAIIKDATGSIYYYKSGHGLKQGQTFSGYTTVKVLIYNSLYTELTAIDASFTGDGASVDPEAVTLATLKESYKTWQNAYVKVEGLKVTAVSGKNVSVTDGTNEYVVYTNYANATCVAGDILTATGTVTKYGTAEQLKVWSAAGLEKTGAVPVITASDIDDVPADGVTDATKSVTIANAAGWTVSVQGDGTVVTAASIADGTITYSVSANTTSEARKGSITVTLSKTGETSITATIEVNQLSSGASKVVLWAETWTGGTASESPAAYGQEGTTVYGNGTVTYSIASGDSNTKLYIDNNMDGSTSQANLLLGKSGKTWTISGIPTGGATKATLTFYSNNTVPLSDNFTVTSSTEGVSLGAKTAGGESAKPYSYTYEITIDSTVTSFDLKFTNGQSSNVRLDDISVEATLSE